MDNLWVLILLLVVGSTIVTVRLFRNGAREDADAAFEALAPAGTRAGARSRASRTKAATGAGAAPAAGAVTTAAEAAAPTGRARATAATPPPAPAATTTEDAAPPARARTRRAASKAAAPAVWPGGDCPNCGSPTVPSAKFCGECGHRLTP